MESVYGRRWEVTRKQAYTAMNEEYDKSVRGKPGACCPNCGGTSGYTYRMTVEYVQLCTWDGEPHSATAAGGWEGKLLECEDCYRVFRRSTIEKLTQQAV